MSEVRRGFGCLGSLFLVGGFGGVRAEADHDGFESGQLQIDGDFVSGDGIVFFGFQDGFCQGVAAAVGDAAGDDGDAGRAVKLGSADAFEDES